MILPKIFIFFLGLFHENAPAKEILVEQLVLPLEAHIWLDGDEAVSGDRWFGGVRRWGEGIVRLALGRDG